MLVLHAATLEGKLALWGEAPLDPSAAPIRRRGRPKGSKANPEALPLPFDAGIARLTETLTSAIAGFQADREDAVTRIAWLPTIKGQPVASSPLIAETPPGAEGAEIAPWAVSASA